LTNCKTNFWITFDFSEILKQGNKFTAGPQSILFMLMYFVYDTTAIAVVKMKIGVLEPKIVINATAPDKVRISVNTFSILT
jgi:hypothetical protein